MFSVKEGGKQRGYTTVSLFSDADMEIIRSANRCTGSISQYIQTGFVKDPVQSGIISMIGDVGDDISPPRMLHCFALRLFLGA